MSTSTDLSAPPLVSDRDDRGPGFRGFIILLFIVTVAAIGLRFWSRAMGTPQGQNSGRFWWDDWLALASVPFILALCIICFILVDLGLGRHLSTIPFEDLVPLLKLLFAAHFAWDIALYLAKESALLFFRRVFPKENSTTIFNIALWVTHGLNTLWLIGIVLGAILRCDPVALNWFPTLPGTCGPLQGAWLGTAIPSLFIDFIILLLPMPTIWGLQTSQSKRVGLTIIFALGYCVCIVTIGRLVTIGRSGEALETDVTYDGIPALYWLAADAPITLLSICLPAMLTLYRRLLSSFITPLATEVSSNWTSRRRHSGSRSQNGKFSQSTQHNHSRRHNSRGGMQRIYDSEETGPESLYSIDSRRDILRAPKTEEPYLAQVHGGAVNNMGRDDVPLESIRVHRDIKINRPANR